MDPTEKTTDPTQAHYQMTVFILKFFDDPRYVEKGHVVTDKVEFDTFKQKGLVRFGFGDIAWQPFSLDLSLQMNCPIPGGYYILLPDFSLNTYSQMQFDASLSLRIYPIEEKYITQNANFSAFLKEVQQIITTQKPMDNVETLAERSTRFKKKISQPQPQQQLSNISTMDVAVASKYGINDPNKVAELKSYFGSN